MGKTPKQDRLHRDSTKGLAFVITDAPKTRCSDATDQHRRYFPREAGPRSLLIDTAWACGPYHGAESGEVETSVFHGETCLVQLPFAVDFDIIVNSSLSQIIFRFLPR